MTERTITAHRKDAKLLFKLAGDPEFGDAKVYLHYMQMPTAVIPQLILVTIGHRELTEDEWPSWLLQLVSDNMPDWWGLEL